VPGHRHLAMAGPAMAPFLSRHPIHTNRFAAPEYRPGSGVPVCFEAVAPIVWGRSSVTWGASGAETVTAGFA
jgi:hypothetical protein